MLLPETEVDFSPEVSCFSVNFSIFGRYFGKKFVEFDLFLPIFKISRLHLSILAKSLENFTFFASKLEKQETEVDFSPEVSFFSLNFSCF
jgi:hypothetical protein